MYKKFLWPSVFALLVASIYIIFDNVKISDDALEYDLLSDSILTGKYYLDGIPSMLREPGYPFFRAFLKLLGSSYSTILWIQGLLYAATVFLVGVTAYKIDSKVGAWGAWGAAFSYGLAFYPSKHLSENLTAFLLALVGFLLISNLNNPTLKKWLLLGIVSGGLLLTRYAFLLIPVVCILSLWLVLRDKSYGRKNIIIGGAVMILTMVVILTPWMFRNYKQFGVFNVAGRMGAIIYPRAWKAEKSWQSLADSYLSVFVGRGLLFTFYPSNQSIFQEQWGDWWRDPEKIKLWGKDPAEIDQNRKKEALRIVTSDFEHFSKFAVWTGVDMLRFLALPNPVFPAKGSPIEGTYGPLARDAKLSLIQIGALSLAHLIQLLWFLLILFSTTLGFKKYGWRFVPGLILLSIVIAHSVGDGTARHATPIHPWIMAAIFMTIIQPLLNNIEAQLKNLGKIDREHILKVFKIDQ